jgi:hypothetical protein
MRKIILMLLAASILLPLNLSFGATQCHIKCMDPCPFQTWSKDECKDYCDKSPELDWCKYKQTDKDIPEKGGSCYARYQECYGIPDELPVAPGALYRYWHTYASDWSHTVVKDHICTTDPNEYGVGTDVIRYEGILGYIETTQKSGTTPLYRYYNKGTQDHVLNSNYNGLGEGRNGYKLEGIIGYIYTQQEEGIVPLVRYWNADTHDHLCTPYPNPPAEGEGYQREIIIGYIKKNP